MAGKHEQQAPNAWPQQAEELRSLLRGEVADMPDPSVRLAIGKTIADAVADRAESTAASTSDGANRSEASTRSQLYRDNARASLAEAERAASDDLRQTYQEMARHWLDMAELAEGFERRHRDEY